ncbi:MAG: NADPH-dependent F420 reductase [Alphaproteobacteria bacterium]|nr:MAG: NADPH-dependent F420 reductase [Alphaproteobacteria bacterium]
MTTEPLTIAILGGTGALGGGLAKRWSQAGLKVIIGSRTLEKAEGAVEDFKASFGDVDLTPMENLAAAKAADIAVLTVPFAHQAATLEYLKGALEGKILIDVTVPLVPPKVAVVQLPEGGSAGEIAQNLLGETVKVVSAFQNIAAAHLAGDHEIDCDVLVSGNDREACTQVIELAGKAGMRGFYAGPIANAVAAEALTSILIQINRTHKCHAGIRISGLSENH